MAYDFEELQFGGKVMHIAEKEFAGSFSEDTNGALVTSICKEYADQGKPKDKAGWIRKRLESLFLCVAERPVWVSKLAHPRWPFLNGKPMVFVCQYSLGDGPLVQERFIPGLVLYLFADRHPVESGGYELRYRVVEQDPAL